MLPRVTIAESYTSELVSKVAAGVLDVTFAGLVPEAAGVDRVLAWSQLLVLCVHRDNLLASQRSVPLTELTGGEISPIQASLLSHLRSMHYFQKDCLR